MAFINRLEFIKDVVTKISLEGMIETGEHGGYMGLTGFRSGIGGMVFLPKRSIARGLRRIGRTFHDLDEILRKRDGDKERDTNVIHK